MMQQIFSALFLPAIPVGFSGTLMAIAAVLAGSVLLGTIVRAFYHAIAANVRKRSGATSEYVEDKAA